VPEKQDEGRSSLGRGKGGGLLESVETNFCQNERLPCSVGARGATGRSPEGCERQKEGPPDDCGNRSSSREGEGGSPVPAESDSLFILGGGGVGSDTFLYIEGRALEDPPRGENLIVAAFGQFLQVISSERSKNADRSVDAGCSTGGP